MTAADLAIVLILGALLVSLSIALLLAKRWENAASLAPRRDADLDVPALPWTWD